jgi:peptidoglycan L-alanyl-D-glutamate endopeptidase CwlK
VLKSEGWKLKKSLVLIQGFMFKFSKRSLDNLQTCHSDMQDIMHAALMYSKVDFGITEGHRSIERQAKLYHEGKSKLDGYKRKSKHNYSPSQACDIIVSGINKPYDFNHLSYLAGVIQTVAQVLHEDGEITHKIRWGGNWDDDKEIITDQKFQDLVHFELYEV